MNKKEFIIFFKTRPEQEQTDKILENYINKEHKNMKNNKTNTTKTLATKTRNTKVNNMEFVDGIKLEDNIPIPTMEGRKGIKSDFRKVCEVMKIGQSFEADKLPKNYYQLQKALAIKLVNKKNDKGGYRVWRKV